MECQFWENSMLSVEVDAPHRWNMFSETQSWPLLTHSCITLSTLFNNLPPTHRAKSQTCQVLLFVSIFLHNFWGFILIPKSYAIFWKYDDKLMFIFSWYTFEDTFPKVIILTWCILGTSDQMCKASFRAHKQTVISQPWQNHRRRNRKHIFASIWLNGSKTKSSKTVCASAEWKDCFSQSLFSTMSWGTVKVMCTCV